ncbi:PCRF domain-containing protein [Patescibacteria group bacterium]
MKDKSSFAKATADKVKELEWQMNQPDFWQNKDEAQRVIKELGQLKDELEGVGKYDKGNAVITILSGAGGDDSEDFSRILYDMYLKYAQNKNWETFLIHKNENDHGGYRNITFEAIGKGAYGKLKNESGVHRLVRISPFSSQKKRHTSFSMVEVIPKLEKLGEIKIPEDDLKIDFAKSSGPGGQNVNKRETAVRIVHLPTNISVHVESERSQQQNREKAMQIIEARLIKKQEEERLAKEQGMQISKTTEIEWGSQIRSYVFHPYQMIKDHRTGVEERNIDKVLEDGNLDDFVEAEKNL